MDKVTRAIEDLTNYLEARRSYSALLYLEEKRAFEVAKALAHKHGIPYNQARHLLGAAMKAVQDREIARDVATRLKGKS